MSTTSTVWQIPAPELADQANIEAAVVPLRNRLELMLSQVAAGTIPIGASIQWDGTTDPPAGTDGVTRFMLRDGRLISTTTYAAYFALIGHSANGGVNPGGGLFRIPDRRGRVSVGPDNMGTAQGAAGRVSVLPAALFGAGGEERHTTVLTEAPSHGHVVQAAVQSNAVAGTGFYVGVQLNSGTTLGSTQGAGGDQPHNNMQPYVVENAIVRVR